MSIKSGLLLFLLCLSLHACNARRHGPIDKRVKKAFNRMPTKNDGKWGFDKTADVPSKPESSPLNYEVGAKQGNGMVAETQNLKDTKANLRTNDQSLGSVPWRVPLKKRGEKHPGFNLDYSPPKTHPPSHN